MDRSKDKIGFEINFTKYFYNYKSLRSLEEIITELNQIDTEIESLKFDIK